MIIQFQRDSQVWDVVRHALKAFGWRGYLQLRIAEPETADLFIEPIPKPWPCCQGFGQHDITCTKYGQHKN